MATTLVLWSTRPVAIVAADGDGDGSAEKKSGTLVGEGRQVGTDGDRVLPFTNLKWQKRRFPVQVVEEVEIIDAVVKARVRRRPPRV